MTGLTHGKHNTKGYRAWQQAKKRCTNVRDKDHPSYGGRGITFSDDWASFENFFRDMGVCPEGLTLGRINNNGGYCKENCEWQDLKTQARNKRNTKNLTVDGETRCIADWADSAGVSRQVVAKRLAAGWSVEEAVGRKAR